MDLGLQDLPQLLTPICHLDTLPLALPPTAREAGSAIEAEELVRSGLAWESRANDTREEAGLPAAGEDETSWTERGSELAAVGPGVGPEETLEASAAVTGTAWLEADGTGLGGVTAEAGSGDAQTLPATLQAPDEALGSSTMPPAIPEATEASGPPSASPNEQPPCPSPLLCSAQTKTNGTWEAQHREGLEKGLSARHRSTCI